MGVKALMRRFARRMIIFISIIYQAMYDTFLIEHDSGNGHYPYVLIQPCIKDNGETKIACFNGKPLVKVN